jgi:hypothetical protein
MICLETCVRLDVCKTNNDCPPRHRCKKKKCEKCECTRDWDCPEADGLRQICDGCACMKMMTCPNDQWCEKHHPR